MCLTWYEGGRRDFFCGSQVVAPPIKLMYGRSWMVCTTVQVIDGGVFSVGPSSGGIKGVVITCNLFISLRFCAKEKKKPMVLRRFQLVN